MFCEEIRTKTRPFLYINLLIKYSVQQQIHFNGNVFGNKWCRLNEGSLYQKRIEKPINYNIISNLKQEPLSSQLTLKLPITTIVVCYVVACDFKSHFCKQCGPRSDCSCRSSLIKVHTVCLYANIGLKSLQENSEDDINRRHFQMQVFLAF